MWYRGEAERLAKAERFREAVQADFLGLILELDERRLVRFQPSKTPGEYAAEPGLADPARQALQHLVRLLYGYAFARLPCGAGEFGAWRELARPERYAPAA